MGQEWAVVNRQMGRVCWDKQTRPLLKQRSHHTSPIKANYTSFFFGPCMCVTRFSLFSPPYMCLVKHNAGLGH